MNLSAPAGVSLYNTIDSLALEKVDADKNIPASLDDLCLQAFSWLTWALLRPRK